MNGYIAAALHLLPSSNKVLQPGQVRTCGQVDAYLLPCISYLNKHGRDSPSPACSGGVKMVKGTAQMMADKRACCSGVKAAANRYTDLKDEAAQSLPTSRSHSSNQNIQVPPMLCPEENCHASHLSLSTPFQLVTGSIRMNKTTSPTKLQPLESQFCICNDREQTGQEPAKNYTTIHLRHMNYDTRTISVDCQEA
ncbi:hypothetical protein CDL12_04501 [Handroanthus impetiginosus]|uniref:Bifunctional inhibitor/plant lipid transfer protein/seed storage helical domain-containing protein n=1 Tax=Handroanthus impetiginosus TaxID=429701 RepID=A0A2G9HZ41_9LAMI|nr:hypothetical protein CDL12_04501 [Handroanthus impetiginosus]